MPRLVEYCNQQAGGVIVRGYVCVGGGGGGGGGGEGRYCCHLYVKGMKNRTAYAGTDCL